MPANFSMILLSIIYEFIIFTILGIFQKMAKAPTNLPKIQQEPQEWSRKIMPIFKNRGQFKRIEVQQHVIDFCY